MEAPSETANGIYKALASDEPMQGHNIAALHAASHAREMAVNLANS
jgi:hypothetical protein